jgi:hypothetical protein|tara:strand:+ start:322 stop:579 length:258 start_codon:yes stop_codon:yes gene_type:complete
MREMLLSALKSYYVGHINKHIANVEIYLSRSTGIGEHSDIIEAMDKEVGEIGKYDDRLSMILKYLERRQENAETAEEPKKESKSK